MNWQKTYDNNDNDVWEAPSPYSEDGFQWRLMQKLQGNKIIWYEAHDADLLDPEDGEEFETLELAKEFVELQDKEIWDSFKEEPEDDLS